MTNNRLVLLLVITAAVVLTISVIVNNQVQASEQETKLRFTLYTKLYAEDYDEIEKVRISAYFPVSSKFKTQTVSYDIDWQKYDKEYITSKIVFKPVERGLFDYYKVCIHNYNTDETNCKTWWWEPWSSYGTISLEVPNNYYEYEDIEHRD